MQGAEGSNDDFLKIVISPNGEVKEEEKKYEEPSVDSLTYEDIPGDAVEFLNELKKYTIEGSQELIQKFFNNIVGCVTHAVDIDLTKSLDAAKASLTMYKNSQNNTNSTDQSLADPACRLKRSNSF